MVAVLEKIMSDADNFIKDHPGVKLNEFTEEQVAVTQMVPEEIDGGVKFTPKQVMVTQKTMYINAPLERAFCAQGRHRFYQKDAGKSLYGCRRCSFIKKAHPPTYKFDPAKGTLSHRVTGELV
jgi:hypothetical protein